MSSSALLLSHFTVTTAAGCGNQANLDALQNGISGLQQNNFLDVQLDTWIGRVEAIEEQVLPDSLKNYQCRNNQLAWLALQQDGFSTAVEQAKQRYGSDRIGIFLGTSTSGILSTELAYQTESFRNTGKLPDNTHLREQHHSFSVAEFVRKLYQIKGPAQVVSTACSSSAKVFASAARYIELGLCDAAIVGGVDSLCLTTLYGFNSLQLLAQDICRPADENRQGLSIGEGAAFVILERVLLENVLPEETEHSTTFQSPVYLRGYGESSDAYHMSSPHPEGRGAFQAMQQALDGAAIVAQDIDYINLHGTATPVNDQMEDKALTRLFTGSRHFTSSRRFTGSQLSNDSQLSTDSRHFNSPVHKPIACSSTKGWTGHTLGAAGAIEAIYSALCIQHNFLPQSLNTLSPDATFTQSILTRTQNSIVHTVASNSFGFGGNNCCLILADQPC